MLLIKPKPPEFFGIFVLSTTIDDGKPARAAIDDGSGEPTIIDYPA